MLIKFPSSFTNNTVKGGDSLPNDETIKKLDDFVLKKYDNELVIRSSEIPENVPYTALYGVKTDKRGIHIGQRKLLMNEIEFMSMVYPGYDLVIYAGYAPSEKFTVLADLFPKTKFLLIDPNYPFFITEYCQICDPKFAADPLRKYIIFNRQVIDPEQEQKVNNYQKLANAKKSLENSETPSGRKFNAIKLQESFDEFNENSIKELIEGNTRSYIIQDYLTIQLAERIAEALKVAKIKTGFISDLRTRILAESKTPEDGDIIFNDQLQHVCAKIMNVEKVMFKIRFPFVYDDGLNVNKKILAIPIVQEVRAKFKELFPGPDNWDFYEKTITKKNPNGCPYFTFDGDFYFQPWGPGGTSESRLIASPKSLKEYNCKTYEDSLFTHRLIRILCVCKKIDRVGKLDQCTECTLEKAIWIMYFAWNNGKIFDNSKDILIYYKNNKNKLNEFIARKWRKLAEAQLVWKNH